MGAGRQHPRGEKGKSPPSGSRVPLGRGRRHTDTRHIRQRWTRSKDAQEDVDHGAGSKWPGTAGAEAQAAAGASMAGEQRAGARAQRGPSAGPRGTVGARCAFATSDARGTCRGAAGGVTGARRVWQGSWTLGGTDEGAGEGPGASGGGGALGEGPGTEGRAPEGRGGRAQAPVHACTCASVCGACVHVCVCARASVCRIPCAVCRAGVARRVCPWTCLRPCRCNGPGGSRGGTWGPRLKKALRGGESSQVRSGSPAQPSESGPRDRAGVNQAGFPRGPHPRRLPAWAPGPLAAAPHGHGAAWVPAWGSGRPGLGAELATAPAAAPQSQAGPQRGAGWPPRGLPSGASN